MSNPEGTKYMTTDEYISALLQTIQKQEALIETYKAIEKGYQAIAAKDNQIEDNLTKALASANSMLEAYKGYCETLKSEVARLTILLATKGDD